MIKLNYMTTLVCIILIGHLHSGKCQDIDSCGCHCAACRAGDMAACTSFFPETCLEILNWAKDYAFDVYTQSGVYTIYPVSRENGVTVYCDMTTDGGGWTVIQRRKDGSEEFGLGFNQYGTGFGDVTEEFWLGLEILYWILNKVPHQLRIDMNDGNVAKVAEYRTFNLGNIDNFYQLNVAGFSGDAGDSLSFHNGNAFSTWEFDNDLLEGDSCSVIHGSSGWWFGDCYESNLNGFYMFGGDDPQNVGIQWFSFNNSFGLSLQFTEMKIRPTIPNGNK